MRNYAAEAMQKKTEAIKALESAKSAMDKAATKLKAASEILAKTDPNQGAEATMHANELQGARQTIQTWITGLTNTSPFPPDNTPLNDSHSAKNAPCRPAAPAPRQARSGVMVPPTGKDLGIRAHELIETNPLHGRKKAIW